MKKYVFLFLMCCPLMAFGAPSVRALGSNAISGTVGAASVNKVTPTKASSVSANRGSSVARVGSLRAKATTATAPSANSASTSRFPVILPTKVYNTANTPRPTGYSSSSTVVPTDLGDLPERVTNIENMESNTSDIVKRVEDISNLTNTAGDTTIVTTVNEISDLEGDTAIVTTVNEMSNLEGDTDIVNRIEDISNLTNTAGDTTIVTTVNKLDKRSDSIRIAGATSPFDGTPGTASEPRAWIWVEQ